MREVNTKFKGDMISPNNMKRGEALLFLGFLGISSTLLLALLWAPSVSIDAFESPAAQRIFYWHVPAAWAAFIAFGALLSVLLDGCFDAPN